MCFSQDFLSRSFTVDLGSAFGFSDVLTSRSACHWIPLHLANTNTMILPLPRFGNPHFSTIIWSIFFTSLGQWTVSHLTGSNRFNYETVTATMYGVCDFDVWYFGWDLSLTSPLAMSLRYVFHKILWFFDVPCSSKASAKASVAMANQIYAKIGTAQPQNWSSMFWEPINLKQPPVSRTADGQNQSFVDTHRYWCYTHMMMRTSGYRLQVFRQVAQSHPPWSRDALDIAVFPMWHDEKTMRDSSCISKIVQFLVFHMASAANRSSFCWCSFGRSIL